MKTKIWTKKEFDTRPIKFLCYIPDRLITVNDRLLYSALTRQLIDRNLTFADTKFQLDQMLAEKRSNIHAVIREECDIGALARLTQLAYCSESVYNAFNIGRLCATVRYDNGCRTWVEGVNYAKLERNEEGLLMVDKAVTTVFHTLKFDLMVYNLYINGYEATREK